MIAVVMVDAPNLSRNYNFWLRMQLSALGSCVVKDLFHEPRSVPRLEDVAVDEDEERARLGPVRKLADERRDVSAAGAIR
jgi:hypothetical protein